MPPNATEPMAGFPMLLAALAVLAIAPFLLAMITSFIKFVVVGSLIRTALGTQQIPPTIVITGLAMVLTVPVMWPVATQAYRAYERTTGSIADRLEQALPAVRGFLARNASEDNIALFRELHGQLAAGPIGGDPNAATPDTKANPIIQDITTLIPAFVVTELMEAFVIGFIVFVPFLIVDLVVSNMLMAVGMQYLQPTIISVPLKLLLFVLIDGWQLILSNVILTYV